MTVKHVEEILRTRDANFVSEQTSREIAVQIRKFNELTSTRQDEFSEEELIDLIKAFINNNSYFKKAKILPYHQNTPPAPFNNLIVKVGAKILIRLCREKGEWVFRYNLSDGAFVQG